MTNGYDNKIAQESIFKRTCSKHIFEQALAIGTFQFCVMGSNHWYIQVGENTFDYSLDILNTLPAIITNEKSSFFVSFLKKLNICNGLNGFSDEIPSRLDIKWPFFTETGNQNGIARNAFNVELQKKYFNKVRHVDCNYLIQNKQTCEKCSTFTNSF